MPDSCFLPGDIAAAAAESSHLSAAIANVRTSGIKHPDTVLPSFALSDYSRVYVQVMQSKVIFQLLSILFLEQELGALACRPVLQRLTCALNDAMLNRAGETYGVVLTTFPEHEDMVVMYKAHPVLQASRFDDVDA